MQLKYEHCNNNVGRLIKPNFIWKVIVLAILFALVVKDPDKAIESDGKQSTKLGQDEEWVHDPFVKEQTGMVIRVNSEFLKPPGKEQLHFSRQQLTKQKQMNTIIREMFFYFIFLLVMCVVAYGSRDTQAFGVNAAVKGIFVKSDYTLLPSFDTVMTIIISPSSENLGTDSWAGEKK